MGLIAADWMEDVQMVYTIFFRTWNMSHFHFKHDFARNFM